MKALIFTISIFVIIPYSIFAIDKEEALYYNNWNDSLQDNNLMLSKAYINSNPSKALAYISQAIINTDNVLLKAKCYLQKGIIYNYSYTNKGKAALENYLLAKEIYTQVNGRPREGRSVEAVPLRKRERVGAIRRRLPKDGPRPHRRAGDLDGRRPRRRGEPKGDGTRPADRVR